MPRHTYKKQMPAWLRRLPVGKYSLTELANRTKKAKTYLARTLIKWKVERIYVLSYDANRAVKTVREAIYNWEGEKK